MSEENRNIPGSFTRRNFFKISAASGLLVAAPYIITSKKSGFITEAYAMETGGAVETSPATTPFVEPLPLPVIPTPVASLSPAPVTSQFQRYSQFQQSNFTT